jgi:hypothetical protein
MELKVTTPLSTTQDDTSKQITITGAATVYPFLIPNEGDMFIADIGDGNEGLFQVNLSERKTIFNDTCHVIEYQLIDNVSVNRIRLDDLASKTVKTVHYERNFLEHGQNPLLYEEDYMLVKELGQWYNQLTDMFFKEFNSNEYKTLLVPGQRLPVYDPFLVKTVMSFFTTFDYPTIRAVKHLNVSGDPAMEVTTVWDAIAKRDKHLMKTTIMRKAGLVFSRSFSIDPMLEGIFHSGVTYVVYPKDMHVNANYQQWYFPKQTLEVVLEDTKPHIQNLGDLITVRVIGNSPESIIPLIHPILYDEYYIFSKAFYDRSPNGQSRLELCVNDYLDKKAIDIRTIHALCEACHVWDSLERFYYMPILLMLIKVSILAF